MSGMTTGRSGDGRDEVATVWKFPLDVYAIVQRVSMPAASELLCAEVQHGTLTLWARVNPRAKPVDRLVSIVGTGSPAPPAGQGVYVGTVFDGPWVWHVFDGGDE